MITIEPLMERLSQRRAIFYSEADFQHELAIELRMADPGLQLRLEYPFGEGARASLDVLLRKGSRQFGLELKYLCRAANVTVNGEEFRLRNQSARDLRRYDVCKDIVRIEEFGRKFGATGGVLVLTNDPAYWSSRGRIQTCDAAFDLSDLRTLTGKLSWTDRAGAGTIKGREASLVIENSYPLKWRDYANVGGDGGYLRYLYIPVGQPDASETA
jgi:hypothetical protein